MKMGKQLSDEERIRNRRLFSWRTIPALGLGLFLGFFAIGVCGLKAYGAYDLPYSPDDAQFAQTLMNRGFDEEATRVYERIVHSDQAKPEAKLEAGLSLLGSHRDAVLKATDAADRDKHVKRVQDELDTLTAAYKGKQEPSALILEKALFLLVQNRVAMAMPTLPDVVKQTGVTTRKSVPVSSTRGTSTSMMLWSSSSRRRPRPWWKRSPSRRIKRTRPGTCG